MNKQLNYEKKYSEDVRYGFVLNGIAYGGTVTEGKRQLFLDLETIDVSERIEQTVNQRVKMYIIPFPEKWADSFTEMADALHYAKELCQKSCGSFLTDKEAEQILSHEFPYTHHRLYATLS